MFKNPFSFKGRIRRTEYGLTQLIIIGIYILITILSYSRGPSEKELVERAYQRDLIVAVQQKMIRDSIFLADKDLTAKNPDDTVQIQKNSKSNESINKFSDSKNKSNQNYGIVIVIISLILIILMVWLNLASGAKRCHDMGKSGIWQIIPFYFLWMLFQSGQPEINEYGANPKQFI